MNSDSLIVSSICRSVEGEERREVRKTHSEIWREMLIGDICWEGEFTGWRGIRGDPECDGS